MIVLRGDIDAATVERLALHLQGVLDARTRFVTVDAAAVDSYDPDLLDLLGRTQHRLGSHRGMLQVRGLHPSLLPPAGSVPGPRPGLPGVGAGPMIRPGSRWREVRASGSGFDQAGTTALTLLLLADGGVPVAGRPPAVPHVGRHGCGQHTARPGPGIG